MLQGNTMIDIKQWYDYYNYDTSDTANEPQLRWEDAAGGKASLRVLKPSLDVRYYLSDDRIISPYLFVSVFKVQTQVDVQGTWSDRSYATDGSLSRETSSEFKDGKLVHTRTYYDTDGNITREDSWEDDYNSIISAAEKLLSPIGGMAGIGVDYHITDQLSFFAELAVQGVRFESGDFNWSFEHENDEDDLIDWRQAGEGNFDLLFGLTKGYVGIRFHF